MEILNIKTNEVANVEYKLLRVWDKLSKTLESNVTNLSLVTNSQRV